MDQQRQGLRELWPLLATCAGLIAMGVFIITATDEWSGWVFIAFGAVVIGWTVVTAAIAATRGRRD